MSIRVYDIPHATSRAVIFAATIPVPFAGGSYVFDGQWIDLVVPIPLRRGIYVVRSLVFGADVSEADWQSAIVTTPVIWWGQTADSLSSTFRFPIPLNKYTEGTEFNETIRVTQEPSFLKVRVIGELQQTPNLVGRAVINASVNLVAYEISDDAWIREYLKGWSK